MFVDEAAINKILNCKVCESKLKDPRILPCGQSVCAECIPDISDANKERIKCQSCSKTHEIPRDGFPENKVLVEITMLKSNEVSCCKTIAEIKSILEKISEKSLRIESGLEIGETTIRNKCDKVRNDVQLAIEEAHLELDKFHKTFLDEIDAHESECQRNLKKLQEIKTDEALQILTETKTFEESSISILSKNELDESKLQIILNDGKKLLRKVQNVDDRLETNILNNKKIDFAKTYQKLTSRILGEIKINEIQPRFGKNDSTLNQIDLRAHLNDCDIDKINLSTFCFLENGSICMAYINLDLVPSNQNLNKKISMCLFNRQGNILKKNERCFETKTNCCKLESTTINNMIYLSIQTLDPHVYEFEIRRIDLNLNTNEIDIFDGYPKIYATPANLLVYDKINNIIVKRDLMELESQENNTFMVCEEGIPVTSFFELNENYVIARRDKVALGDIYDYGRVSVNFEIDYCKESSKCFPYSSHYIVSHEQSKKKVNFYSLYEDGRIGDDASLERLPANVEFIGTSNDMLFFFDKSELKVYYF